MKKRLGIVLALTLALSGAVLLPNAKQANAEAVNCVYLTAPELGVRSNGWYLVATPVVQVVGTCSGPK